MRKKRISKKNQDLIQSLLFFASTIITICGLIIYLWVYTEIDESVLSIDIQRSTANELRNEIEELDSIIESLLRVDAISTKAQLELNMVYAHPETLIVIYDSNIKVDAL
ncbi:MAG: hypothetical protein HOI03_08910 [Candidatus Marinimicrobia bacterium]|nr:hypothetical protein [Candidatus Neomarinimicrobiota bacterium]